MSLYNKSENKGAKRSDIPTPMELCKMLHKLVTEVYQPSKILDPCCGDRRLTNNFDCEIINYEIKEGSDFLLETQKIHCDLVIMNPPFNIGTGRKLAVEVFMEKVLELVGTDVPIILITPMGFRLNQRYRSKRWLNMRDNYPDITSIISLPLDCFANTLFHCEVLVYNLDLHKNHYFIDYSL
tara:strand:+ start:1922 stop:2467 length:546 start_codon:yes stop_codon:yes gene_type:complete